MATLSRKQREIIEREGRLLEVARRMLLKSGYHGLTMAKIATAMEYSKGTIYQHFSCKEEVIVALAEQSIQKQYVLVSRAAEFRGRPRERMMAVGEATQLFQRLHPDDSRIFQIMNGEAIMQKASPESLIRMRGNARRAVDVMLGIVRDAIALGDLQLHPGHAPEDLVFHLWVLGESGKAAASSWMPPFEIGVENAFASLFRTGLILADGYGWRPLSTEHDYSQILRRIRAEVFPEESARTYGASA